MGGGGDPRKCAEKIGFSHVRNILGLRAPGNRRRDPELRRQGGLHPAARSGTCVTNASFHKSYANKLATFF
jgi:hypothetical protein